MIIHVEQKKKVLVKWRFIVINIYIYINKYIGKSLRDSTWSVSEKECEWPRVNELERERET